MPAGTNQSMSINWGRRDCYGSYLIAIWKSPKTITQKNSLFTLNLGLNDFMNHDREAADVADFSSVSFDWLNLSQQYLVIHIAWCDKGAQFKYSTEQEIIKVRGKIIERPIH